VPDLALPPGAKTSFHYRGQMSVGSLSLRLDVFTQWLTSGDKRRSTKTRMPRTRSYSIGRPLGRPFLRRSSRFRISLVLAGIFDVSRFRSIRERRYLIYDLNLRRQKLDIARFILISSVFPLSMLRLAFVVSLLPRLHVKILLLYSRILR